MLEALAERRADDPAPVPPLHHGRRFFISAAAVPSILVLSSLVSLHQPPTGRHGPQLEGEGEGGGGEEEEWRVKAKGSNVLTGWCAAKIDASRGEELASGCSPTTDCTPRSHTF